MVKIGKRWEPGSIDISRTSPLGNPFYLSDPNDDYLRNMVCDQYHHWFKHKIKDSNSDIMQELLRIYKITKTQDVILGCYCAPKRCHGETIKKFLDQMLDGTFCYEDF